MKIMNKKEAAMWGLLIGDAAGIPYEFKNADEIPRGAPFDSLVPPRGFRRSHAGVKKIVWSDDGAQALAVADSLTRHRGKYRHKDVLDRITKWWRAGDYTPDGVVFDIGIQTARSLQEWEENRRRWTADESSSNGNGALMRTLPLALFCKVDSMAQLACIASDMSTLTHGHVYSRAACALYTMAARMACVGGFAEKSFDLAERELAKIDGDLVQAIRFKTPTVPKGTGFVLDTLAFAREAIRQGWDFPETVRRAIALGGDTDTTASVAGGIVAASRGDEIPGGWARDLFDPDHVATTIIYDAVR